MPLRRAALNLAASLPRGNALRVALLRVLAGPKKAIFTEVILDDPEYLLHWWPRATGYPVLHKHFAHHLTIRFKPTPHEVLALPLGSKVSLQVVGYAQDDKAQAVVVKATGVHTTNDIPHITVATDGTSPIYSNELLHQGWEPIKGPRLTGTVGFFDGKEHRWDLSDTVYEESALSL